MSESSKTIFDDLNVSRETFKKLERYHALLVKWQASVNLVGPKTLAQAWDRHFVDSAQILPFMPPDLKNWADFGTGAGFPGLVLAILDPARHFTLVDSDFKKCQFLKAVCRDVGCENVRVVPSRIEEMEEDARFDGVVSRALAPLKDLMAFYIDRQNDENFTALLLKGERWQEEIREAESFFAFDCADDPSHTDPAARILKITNLRNA